MKHVTIDLLVADFTDDADMQAAAEAARAEFGHLGCNPQLLAVGSEGCDPEITGM